MTKLSSATLDFFIPIVIISHTRVISFFSIVFFKKVLFRHT